jgi:DNA-binding PadR family transcriptional regulator
MARGEGAGQEETRLLGDTLVKVGERDRVQLFLLAELSVRGPLSGRYLQREARIARSELWAQVPITLIHASLRHLERDGLVAVGQGEPAGGRPARTVYVITPAGMRELEVRRDALLAQAMVAERPRPRRVIIAGAPWWAKARIAFAAWLEMPLARRSGELR